MSKQTKPKSAAEPFDGLQKTVSSLPDDLSGLSSDELRTALEAIRGSVPAVIDVAAAANAVEPFADPNTNLTSELNNIDFAKLIGGPLQAAVQAQAAASMTTVKFIQEVGFERDEAGTVTGVKYVDFKYDGKTGETNPDGTEKTVSKAVKVPLLSMLTIPNLRVEDVDINLNVKLNSVETKNVSNSLNVKADLGINYAFVKLKVSAAVQRTSTTGVKVEKEYAMNVKVHATQDQMPGGLEKILNLLEG
jgi:hypothetical protein